MPLLKAAQIKILFLLLLLATICSACLSRTSSPVSEADKQQSYPPSQDSLELLLRHLRLTDRDLTISNRDITTDPFRLQKVNIFLENPLKIEPYAKHLSKDINNNLDSIEKITKLALRELGFNLKSNHTHNPALKDYATLSEHLFSHIDEKARNELLEFFTSAWSGQEKMNKAFEALSQSDIGYLGNYFSEMILHAKIMKKAVQKTPGQQKTSISVKKRRTVCQGSCIPSCRQHRIRTTVWGCSFDGISCRQTLD